MNAKKIKEACKVVKRADILRYLKYKALMEPVHTVVFALCSCFLLLAFAVFNSTAGFICIAAAFLCLGFWNCGYKDRINDFTVAVRYPFCKTKYLYQSVQRRNLQCLSCKELYRRFYEEMRQVVPDSLPPGTYKVVTQAMFVQGIRDTEHIQIIKKRKAYRKKIKKLHQAVFLGRCKECSGKCPAQTSSSLKQFYYVKFMKGCT